MALYLINNGAAQTTAAPVAVTTGTAIKTLLQVVPVTTMVARVREWGISFDGSAAATPGKVELIETDVAATVTAAAAADFTKYDAAAIAQGTQTTFFQVGTALSGYTASAEGTITAVRNLAPPQFIAPTTQYQFQIPLGMEPTIQAGKFARIRVTFAAAVNAYCYMLLEV
jgi:hypothetical protein